MKKQTYPFRLITHIAKPKQSPSPSPCIMCQDEQAAMVLYNYINPFVGIEQGGPTLLDIDSHWREQIEKQQQGIVEAVTYQPLCNDCLLRLLSIQLGSRRAAQQAFTMTTFVGTQKKIRFAYIVSVELDSPSDEGTPAVRHIPDAPLAELVQTFRRLN